MPKSTPLLAGWLGVVLLSQAALAQGDPKLRHDPTYSVFNYKHPNKAALARQWDEGIVLNRQTQRRITVGNHVPPGEHDPDRRSPLRHYRYNNGRWLRSLTFWRRPALGETPKRSIALRRPTADTSGSAVGD